MNSSILKYLSLALLAGVLGSWANVQAEGSNDATKPDRKAARQAWLQSHPEAAAKFQAKKAEIVKRFDSNGDGKLDAAERTAAKPTLKEERKEKQEARYNKVQEKFSQLPADKQQKLLQRFDKDGDGKISQDEFKQARREHRAEKMKQSSPSIPPSA